MINEKCNKICDDQRLSIKNIILSVIYLPIIFNIISEMNKMHSILKV